MQALKQIPLLLASLAVLAFPVRAAPGPADVQAMRTYVERNRAYTPAERAEALRAVELLPGLAGTPARFELEAAHIAALADNGHSVLLPPQWPSRYRRSPVHLGLFADGLFVVSAPAVVLAAAGSTEASALAMTHSINSPTSVRSASPSTACGAAATIEASAERNRATSSMAWLARPKRSR